MKQQEIKSFVEENINKNENDEIKKKTKEERENGIRPSVAEELFFLLLWKEQYKEMVNVA